MILPAAPPVPGRRFFLLLYRQAGKSGMHSLFSPASHRLAFRRTAFSIGSGETKNENRHPGTSSGRRFFLSEGRLLILS
jgi:hypothetical protein